MRKSDDEAVFVTRAMVSWGSTIRRSGSARVRVGEPGGERVGGEVEHHIAEAVGAVRGEARVERSVLGGGERTTEAPLELVHQRTEVLRAELGAELRSEALLQTPVCELPLVLFEGLVGGGHEVLVFPRECTL